MDFPLLFAFDRLLPVEANHATVHVLLVVAGRTSRQVRSWRLARLLAILLVLLAQLLGALFGVFADTLGRDALAALPHVRSERALLLLLAERTGVLAGSLAAGRRLANVTEQFGLSAGGAARARVTPLLLALLLFALRDGIVERILERPVRELLIVPVDRSPERRVLDAVAHVVDIHRVAWYCAGHGYEILSVVFNPPTSLIFRRQASKSLEKCEALLLFNETSRVLVLWSPSTD